jgi:hypothetical protein
MKSRLSNSFLVMAVVTGAAVWSALPAAGQSAPRANAPAPPTASAAPKAAKPWTPPRTSWGDPDIQGWFSNRTEDATPLERPAQFEGRRLEDVKGEELAAIKRQQQQRTIAQFQDDPLSAPQHWWQDDLRIVDGQQAWLIVDPPDGKIPATTAAAKQRAAARTEARRGRGPADSWEDRSLYDRCITRGLPGSMMPAIYGNSYQIVQAPGYVVIRYEMIHETRVIPLDGSPHAAPEIQSYMGDPRGHWEGDTLVVETTNFRDEGAYRNANGATLRLMERFRRAAADKVLWSVTVDDPETWVKPWTFSMPLTVDDSQAVLEYSCHEGNYGLRNILSAARSEERKAEEKKTADDAAKKNGAAQQK